MLTTVNVRFFAYANHFEEMDVYEITEGCFEKLTRIKCSRITYERHTVREHGVSQVCLTIELPDWPEMDELELFNV